MFINAGGMLAVVALFFIIFVEAGGPETGFILLAIAAVLFAVSRLTPWLERRRVLTTPREALVTLKRDRIWRIGLIRSARFDVPWLCVVSKSRKEEPHRPLSSRLPGSPVALSSGHLMSWSRCRREIRSGPGGSCSSWTGMHQSDGWPESLKKVLTPPARTLCHSG
jgi:hypothetical protein